MVKSPVFLKTKDVMSHEVLTVDYDNTVHEVVSFLLKHKISNSPVVRHTNGGPSLIGFISEADCLKALANELYFSSKEQTASELMKPNPYCVGPEEDVFTLSDIFTQKGFRHIPVVDEHGILLGIVSRRNILRIFYEITRDKEKLEEQRRNLPDPTSFIQRRFVFMKK